MSDLIKDWITKAGYRAVVVRRPSFSGDYLCGYVSIPQTNPLFGIDYTPSVSGEVTYSGDRGEKGTWWYGFHFYDASDRCAAVYATRECERLAKQLRDIEPLCESEGTRFRVIEQNEVHKTFRVRLKDSNGVVALVADEKYGDRIAALWNMAERLGLSTEEINGRKIDHALHKLEELELMVERWDLK